MTKKERRIYECGSRLFTKHPAVIFLKLCPKTPLKSNAQTDSTVFIPTQ